MIYKIIDSIMGSGKTTWAIKHMNAHPEQRYIYITPLLNETERVVHECPLLNFQLPKDQISKSAD